MTRIILLSSLALLILAFIGYLLFATQGARDSGPISVLGMPAGERTAESEHVSSQLVAPARVPLEPKESVGSFLEEYWGSEWPEMKEKYFKQGIDPGESLASNGLKPWDDVKAEVRATARSYYERDLAFMRTMFLGKLENGDRFLAQLGVTEDVKDDILLGLSAELGDIDAELGVLCNRYVSELDAAMARALTQAPETYPLVDLRPEEKSEGDFHRIAVESGGWYAQYHLNYKDCPELAGIDKERGSLVAKRTAQMKSFIEKARRSSR